MPSETYVRSCLYGDPKTGKTRTATAIPWNEFSFGNKAAYIAWDRDSEMLSSTLVADREHLIIKKPEWKEGKNNTLTFDPYSELVRLGCYNYAKEDINTVILDTGTTACRDLMYAIAENGYYTKDGPITITSKDGKQRFQQPTMGDFGAAQRTFAKVIDDYYLTQPYNFVLICHSAQLVDKETKETIMGGPASVGSAGIDDLASMFQNCFRQAVVRERQPGPPPVQYKTRRLIYTSPNGIWLTGIRTGHPTDPIGIYDLDKDAPSNFWRAVCKAQLGE